MRASPLNATLTAMTVAVCVGVIVGSSVYAPPARAVTVVCTNCSTIWNQMMEYAKAVETSLNTARQLQTQIQQYNDMMKQGLSLPNSLFNSITSDMHRLQAIYQDSRALAHSMTNLDRQFRDQFKGYEDYFKSISESSGYLPGQYEKWSARGFDNARTAMMAAGVNVSTFESEDALLRQLVQRSQTAQGRMQAIQAGNEIAAQQVQQLQKLRELLAAQITLQANWIAQQTEQQAQAAASMAAHKGTLQESDAKGYNGF